MLKNYFLVAFRNILRNKTISFINIFGLAVSMTVCLLLIIIVADQYSYDNFHTDEDRIYRVVTDRLQVNQNDWNTASTAYPLAEILKGQEGIEQVAVLKKNFAGTAQWEQSEIPFEGIFATTDFLEIFSFPLAKGNPQEALNLANGMVLTDKLANKLFGKEDPLGKTVQVEAMGEFIVTGVLEPLAGKTHFYFEALASTEVLPILIKEGALETSLTNWEYIYDNYIYLKTSPDFNPKSLDSFFSAAAQSNYDQEADYEYVFKLQQLGDIAMGPLKSNNMGFSLPSFIVYILLALALLVLFSACFNYANLTTARAVNRAKEIGVRKVIGAERRHIIFQFMVEAILISLIAFGFAAFIVEFLLPAFNNMFASVGAPVRFDKVDYLYLFFVAFALMTGLIAGVVPAIFFSTTNALVALRKSINLENLGKKIGFARFSIKKVLVVAQFAFSIFFVVTIITIYQQFNKTITADHGFESENVLNVKLEGMSYEKMKNEFSSIPAVETISAATFLPALGSNNGGAAHLKGSEDAFSLYFTGVGENYLESLDIPMVAGKDFPENMPKEERYTIINEAAVERFGWTEPTEALGHVIELDETEMEIIGVMKDFHFERIEEKIRPMCLRYQPEQVTSMIVSISGQNENQTLAQLEQGWKKHTNRAFNYSFFEDDMKFSYGHYNVILAILGYVTLIVVSLACLGLLGMVIFHIQNRTKEIGIRKTLGANAIDIIKTVSKSFLLLIAISYLIAGPLAYFANNMWLQNNANRIDFGIGTIAFGFVIVLLIVSLTIGSQVYKALKINPVESLKSE